MLNEIASGQLKAFVERAERLQSEKDTLDEAVRDLHGQVKDSGFDLKLFKETLKVRRQDAAARAEHGELLALYLDAAK